MLFTEEGGAIDDTALGIGIEGKYATAIGLCVADGHVRRTSIECQLHGKGLEGSTTVFDVRRHPRQRVYLKSRLVRSAQAQQAKLL